MTTARTLARIGGVAFAGFAVTFVCLAADRDRQASQRALDVRETSAAIDREIQKRLVAEKVTPSPLADDAEFIRRASLDICGVIPSADRVAAFLDSNDPAKRTQLIEELLASPQYGKHFADVWQALLLPRTSDNRRLQPQPMITWLEEGFNGNKPWDQLVRDLITANGTQDKNGAVTFFIANPTPDKITDHVSRLFLGVQLQCAQCHNHPFTKWKQDEYWAMAAFFSKVRADNPNRAAKQGTSPGINEEGRGKQKGLPEAAKTVPAKFFQGEQAKLDPRRPYRPVLAEWLTAVDNPYFARAMVNRTWAQFFGRGLVNPIDDMHDGHPASHPDLLKELSERFAQTGFDLKDLIRAICNSQAYQRTSKPVADNSEDETLFSHVAIKPLTAEQLYDSIAIVLGPSGRDAGPKNRKAGAQVKGMAGNNPRAQFVAFFQADETASATEFNAGIPQVLRLMNAPQMNNANVIQKLAGSGRKPGEVLERLYLTTLARRPTREELDRLTVHIAKSEGERQAYGDILWALLNSSEFTLNH